MERQRETRLVDLQINFTGYSVVIVADRMRLLSV